MSIVVIAGLGNPGSKYQNTRHNIGFALIDKLALKLNAVWKAEARFEAEVASAFYKKRRLLLVKPQTFMNASGRSIGAILRYQNLTSTSLAVIYDDITLELGRPKLSLKGSAGGHNGIADLLAQIGAGFLRYRIGVGAKPYKDIDLADYVLSKFSKDDQKLLADRTSVYLEQLCLIIDKEAEHAMNFINQRTHDSMSATTNNNYKTTFILDLRESKDDSAKVLADLTEILASLGGVVSESEDLGIRAFARAADRRFTQGHYLEVIFEGPGTVPAQLNEKLRLDKRINRIFVESI